MTPPAEPATSDLNVAMEQQWRIFAVVNEWVRFADAKAGLLLAADGVIFTLACGPIASNREYLTKHQSALFFVIAASIFLIVSTAYSLSCVFPKTKPPGGNSLIFFETIARSNALVYRQNARRLSDPQVAYDEVSAQVWAVSKVASRKHRQIAWAVRSLMVALVCGLAAAIAIAFFSL